jgi:hypothetical protein
MSARRKKEKVVVVSPIPGQGDASWIQEALDALPSSGGTIFFPEGNYSSDGSPIEGPRDWSPRTGRCHCKKKH